MAKDLLQLAQPLLDVQPGSCSEKFGGDSKRIRKDVAMFLLKRMAFQMEVSGNAFSSRDDPAWTELGYRPIVSHFLGAFTSLALKFGERLEEEEEEEERYNDPCVDSFQDDKSVGEFAKWLSLELADRAEEQGKDEEEEEVRDDVHRENEVEDEEEKDGEGDKDDEEDEDGEAHSGRDLSKFFPLDEQAKSFTNEAVLLRMYGRDHAINQHITLGVLGGRGADEWPDDAFEMFYYGCAAAMRNIRAGRMDKIPCIAVGLKWWASGEIDPVGFVRVTAKNKITSSSAAAFKSHVEQKCEWLELRGQGRRARKLRRKYLQKSDEELIAALEARVRARTAEASMNLDEKSFQEVEHRYKSSAFAAKPCNLLVGEATYPPQSSTMLRFPLDRNARSGDGDKDLVSGMARTLFGDRVLRWSLRSVGKLSRDRDQATRIFASSLVAS
ncbi:hypothetical protein SELMODRAFT_406126 [Selaginella moellendorffii]|uniref:Uncharacterized protein n=2 Tax=Selaginella moellendorffii TaxID=88036 RepID=D8R1C8_SELML|nr:uncharacterized protein LOC9659626 isoform X2 [Selaginella moellendorffii]XP_024525519.1 uncharacterized protein LOC9659626 isoform X2 [Selaginella moellendorffii]EFJ33530.1 hypothetical protein SELMODRAFT_406126 [Selaginella moellendorffii]|eukprot:XP_002964692.1 uncharacterized protein LOC9659626 isoform X2 [Selaginella moellendorffii]